MKLGTFILIICIVGGIVFLSGLGIWQIKRLAWKEAMIARVEQNLNEAPQSMAEIEALLRNGEDIEYRPVRLSGVFDHEKEQHYFATYKGQAGYYVYTPLKRNNGEITFVNRGYIPLELKDRFKRQKGLVTGVVKIEGLARTAPLQKPNSFVPNNDLVKNIYYWKSLSQMAGNVFDKTDIELTRFFVDTNDALVPGGLPVGGVTRIVFPNSHLQYAITWFGLAGTLLVVGGIFLRGRMKPDDSE